MMDYKLLLAIKIIATIILILCIIALAYCSYDNLRVLRASTQAYDKGVNGVIIEWSADYSNDKELMEQIDKDLQEAQARLEKLGVEFGE